MSKREDKVALKGALYLLPAYLIWGLGPVYWKLLHHVSSFELVLQRTWWSLVFLLIILLMQKRVSEIRDIFRHPSYVGILIGTTLILALNWYLFIWAVNHDQVLQTSLGYYINPLLTVLLGMIFLKEKLRRLQVLALLIAGAGVLFDTISLGQFPWIALTLAGSFAIYGLVHKVIPIKPLPGLCTETLLLSVPSFFYLSWLFVQGNGAMFHTNLTTDLLLIGTCLLTGLPLLFFTMGAKHSTLTTVGFMQYIAPCCSFLLAVFYYKEAFSHEKLITFVMIWVALMIYSLDSIYSYRRYSSQFKKSL